MPARKRRSNKGKFSMEVTPNTTETVETVCPSCNNIEEHNHWTQCDKSTCQQWHHSLCVGLPERNADHLIWYCPECRQTDDDTQYSIFASPLRDKTTESVNIEQDNLTASMDSTQITDAPDETVDKDAQDTVANTEASMEQDTSAQTHDDTPQDEPTVSLAELNEELALSSDNEEEDEEPVLIATVPSKRVTTPSLGRRQPEQPIPSTSAAARLNVSTSRKASASKTARPRASNARQTSGTSNARPRASTSRQPVASTSRAAAHDTSNATATDSEGDTDDEGYATIKDVIAHRYETDGTIAFRIIFNKNNERRWVREEDCDGCVHTVNMYCRTVGLDPLQVEPKGPAGAVSTHAANKNNWVYLQDALRMAKTYGKKEYIQPEAFTGLKHDRDGLYLNQIGSHMFTYLHLHELNVVYVADGQNLFASDPLTKKLVMSELLTARRIHHVTFLQQTEADHCASSAAAIAIEFQRLHRYGNDSIPDVITPTMGRLERIKAILHKEKSMKIPVPKMRGCKAKKVQCPKCEVFLNTSNRSALILHKCKD